MRAPEIVEDEWGKLVVAEWGTFKDAKLFPGGAREWNWDETGTRHVPGIQIQDVAELLDYPLTDIVLSRGRHNRLQVCPDTLEMLATAGIQVHHLQTEDAILRYNELAPAGKVAALIHSTC